MSYLNQLSNSLAAAVQRAAPSVLGVVGRPNTSASAWTPELAWAAAHTLDDGDSAVLALPDGRRVEATVIGRHPGSDLALLRVPEPVLTPADWSAGEGLAVGQVVLTLARPGVLRSTMGIIGGLGDEWRTPAGAKLERYLEVDASLPTGFSGGLLIDGEGRALGVNTRGPGRMPGWTVTTRSLTRLAEAQARRAGGRGFLGVGAWPAVLGAAATARAGQARGLVLVSVEEGGPADRAGLMVGDVVLSLDGRGVQDIPGLIALLEELGGRRVRAQVWRAGAPVELEVEVAAR